MKNTDLWFKFQWRGFITWGLVWLGPFDPVDIEWIYNMKTIQGLKAYKAFMSEMIHIFSTFVKGIYTPRITEGISKVLNSTDCKTESLRAVVRLGNCQAEKLKNCK